MELMRARHRLLTACLLLGIPSCVGMIDGSEPEPQAPMIDAAPSPTPVDAAPAGPCPPDMALVGSACMDLYEAPNQPGELPLVMYSFDEAEDWCETRGKRLCFDDEWEAACGVDDYVYGEPREPGRCNDDKLWKVYDQAKLNGWPQDAAATDLTTLDALFDRARALGGTIAADHVEAIYQGAGSGEHTRCVNQHGVYDLTGNVEEWTRRRDGGAPSFHGNLKGRYWADTRTCGNDITTHGDGFRFYEIGFRCCAARR
jgi:sulfatase modifying factor 1